MNLHEELSRLSQYSPIERLVDATKDPVKYCPEPFTHMLPSFTMDRDGPTLVSLFLISNNYLCEVRIAGPKYFDFIAKKNIQHYGLHLSTHVIHRQDEGPKVYEIAQVTLSHGGGGPKGGFQTQLSYVGDDRDRWLASVFEAIPLMVASV